jgi:hypothetical protein
MRPLKLLLISLLALPHFAESFIIQNSTTGTLAVFHKNKNTSIPQRFYADVKSLPEASIQLIAPGKKLNYKINYIEAPYYIDKYEEPINQDKLWIIDFDKGSIDKSYSILTTIIYDISSISDTTRFKIYKKSTLSYYGMEELDYLEEDELEEAVIVEKPTAPEEAPASEEKK